MRPHRPSPALAVAFLALIVALSGVAFAAVPARDGDVHFCYAKRTGALEVVDTQNDRFRCDRNWRGFTLSRSSLTSDDGNARVTLADDGEIALTSSEGNVRIGAKGVTVSGTDKVDLVTGSAAIQMKKDGTIVIKGKDITLDGSGTIAVKATGDVNVKGSKIGGN